MTSNTSQVRLQAMECIVSSRSGVESFSGLEFSLLLSAAESNLALHNSSGRQNFMALIKKVPFKTKLVHLILLLTILLSAFLALRGRICRVDPRESIKGETRGRVRGVSQRHCTSSVFLNLLRSQQPKTVDCASSTRMSSQNCPRQGSFQTAVDECHGERRGKPAPHSGV